MNTHKKLIISCASFFAIALFIVCSAVSYRYSKSGAIAKLENAIKSKDKKVAASLIKSSGKNFKIDEKNIGSFLDYISSNKKDFKELTYNLHKQAASMGMKSSRNENYWDYYLILKKSAKKFLFFNTYYFEMKPCYVDFRINHASTKLYVDGKYLLTSDSENYYKTLGPFIQGNHKLTTVCESVFGKSRNTSSCHFSVPYIKDKSSGIYICYITTEGLFINIECNYNDAEIFINGKDSGRKAEDFSVIGPVDFTIPNKIYAEKQFPWGVSRSKNTDVRQTGTLSLYVSGITKNLTEELSSVITEFNRSLAYALNTQDVSGLKNLDPNYVGAVRSIINYMKLQNKHFNGNYIKSIIENDKLSVGYSVENNRYIASLNSLDYYDTDYTAGVSEIFMFMTFKKGCLNHYELVYDATSRKWTITGLWIATDG